jgi:DNA-binding IclR family transcriptional regulator
MNQSAAKRALLVLEYLAGKADGAGLTDICDVLSLPKSIGHRLLALLVEAGFVMQHDQNGRYGLTLKLTMLGLRHYVRTGLDDLAQPVLDRLAAETGELARLTIVEGERLVWVAKAQGARSGLRYDPDIDQDTGHDVVLHSTATGKAWLATLPEEDAMRIVAATGFRTPVRFGPNVARDLDTFRQMLQATRRAGFGEAVEEGEPGTAAVAVAIVDVSGVGGGAVVGTLSLAGPMLRFGPERRNLLAGRLSRAAEELGSIWPLRNRLGTASGDVREPAGSVVIQQEQNHERKRVSAL